MKKFKEFDKTLEESWAAIGKAVAPVLKDVAIGVATDMAVDKIKDKLTDSEEEEIEISYTALVLDKDSQKALQSALEDIVPDNWEWKAHHMTINVGKSKDPNIVGEKGTMSVKTLGVDHNLGVIAVGVEPHEIQPISQKNRENPHVTIAINREIGAKPFFSNKIEKDDWLEAPEGLLDMKLVGTVEEVPV